MPSFYFNTYTPLVVNQDGREAAIKYSLPPFVDGSIRREPDLEHEYPAISALCRGAMFAPRLVTGDVVAYSLCRRKYGLERKQRRLTAVLRVIEVCPTHSEGADWYREKGLPPPNNCMVHGIHAKPLEHSHRLAPMRDGAIVSHKQWDAAYKVRSMKWGSFAICEPLFIDLSWNAPEITDEIQHKVFGRIQPTLTPEELSMTVGRLFVKQMRLNLTL